MVPKKLFLTKGVGVHEDKLTSFEHALRESNISCTNLVLISSIFPPHAELISKEEGIKQIQAGQIQFTIYSRNDTNEQNRSVAASVGLARPINKSHYGYLSEYSSYGQTEQQAGEIAESIAVNMLATSQNIDNRPEKQWEGDKHYWKIKPGNLYTSQNITQAALGTDGKWTTVFAAACMII